MYEYEPFHKSNVDNNINDLESLQMNYDENILELKEKLQISRDLRKKSEIERKSLEHRILLLKNQEKFAILQFQNTKKKIEQILINRHQAEERMKIQSISRKKLINNRRYSSDFSKGKNYSRGNMLNKNEEQNENITNNYVQVNEEKEKMKQELIEKLKEDEKERERLENEMAFIEKEEFRLLQILDEEENKK
jgi:hypothetical protein